MAKLAEQDFFAVSEFHQVVGNPKTVHILSSLVGRDVTIPNMLLCGPPGCGKTTCVDILCNKVVRDGHKSRILKMTSFDEREIDDVRTKIKHFAKGRVRVADNSRIDKLVVLDEADSMGSGALQALRNIMDVHSDTTRFIIVCNNSAKIIEPIQSRCAILRFSRVDDSHVRSRVGTICDTVGVEYTPDGLQAIASVAGGDIRRAINCLRSTVCGTGKVTAENVYRVFEAPGPVAIADIFASLEDRGTFIDAVRKLKALIDTGYMASDIVSGFFDFCVKMKLGDSGRRGEVASAIGLAQARVMSGDSTFLQLSAMLWKISNALARNDN